MFRKTSALINKCHTIRKFCAPADPSKPVGFIGCGNMGKILIKHLIQKGTKVLCYDKKPKRMQEVEALGGTAMKSPAEIAKHTDIIFTLLPDYKEIVKVMESEDGLISTAKKGTSIVDLSTIGPVNALRIEMAIEGTGLCFLSAPVSGGTRIDEKNSLIFFVGGEKKYLNTVKPYLNYMAHKDKEKVVFHVGDNISDGQSARICSVLLEGCCMVGASEIMNLGIKLGLDPKVLTEAITYTSGQCWLLEQYNPVPDVVKHSPASSDYQEGERILTWLKALGVAQDTATRIFSPIPVTALACQIFSLALARGYAEKDFSAVYKIYKQTIVKSV